MDYGRNLLLKLQKKKDDLCTRTPWKTEEDFRTVSLNSLNQCIIVSDFWDDTSVIKLFFGE